MSVASKNLFHFTSSYETIINILGGKAFWPRYCCEYDWFKDKSITMYIPMVCFTDIPLSQVTGHMDFYGHYGIGLTKSWATKHQICPVWYIKQKSLSMIRNIVENDSLFQSPKASSFLTLCKLAKGGRCKNRQGDVRRKDFYEEREWRYVPEVSFEKKLILGKVNEQQGNNDDTVSYMLHFALMDIRYIFVDSEDERVDLINKIDELFKDTESMTNLSLLKSRILTYEQLMDDF